MIEPGTKHDLLKKEIMSQNNLLSVWSDNILQGNCFKGQMALFLSPVCEEF